MTALESTTSVEYRTIGWIDGYRFGSNGAIQSRRKCNRWGGYTDEWRDVYFRKDSKTGHLSIRVTVDGVKRKLYVHRLILEAFRGPCPEGMEGCHDPDPDPSNCRIDNLRWDTKKENQADCKRHGRMRRAVGSKQHLAKLTEKDIPVVRQLASQGMSHRDIAKMYHVTHRAIGLMLQGKTWTHVA